MHPCARHALLGKTCCQESQVLVTIGDRRRIEEHGEADFWVQEPPELAYIQELAADQEWARQLNSDGTRNVLRRQLNGDCMFLGATGCRLPHDTRPLVCRLYPWDFDTEGIRPTCAVGCPSEVIPAGKVATDLFEVDRDEAELLRVQLYTEIAAGHEGGNEVP